MTVAIEVLLTADVARAVVGVEVLIARGANVILWELGRSAALHSETSRMASVGSRKNMSGERKVYCR